MADADNVRFVVDAAFQITGRDTIAVGDLDSGVIHPGDELMLVTEGERRPVTVRSIDIPCRPGRSRPEPDRFGILLAGVAKEDVPPGSLLTTPSE